MGMSRPAVPNANSRSAQQERSPVSPRTQAPFAETPWMSAANRFPEAPLDARLQALVKRRNVAAGPRSLYESLGHHDAIFMNNVRPSFETFNRHVATKAAEQMLNFLTHQGPEFDLLEPHLQHMFNEPANGPGPSLDEMKEALGSTIAGQCAVNLTPAQRTHVFNLATGKAFPASHCELAASATCAAFPGLRLAVLKADTTRNNVDQTTFGNSGEAHLLYLDQRGDDVVHFNPAWTRQSPRRA